MMHPWQSCPRAVRGEYNSLRAPRAGNLGRTPRDDNRDDVFNCHEVPIKEYLRKWNFVSFHLFVFAETHFLFIVSNLQSRPNNLVASR